MTIDEVIYIVESCKLRNIHFDTIELTGGEPSVWDNLEEGVKLFGGIADAVTLVTNGNNPQRIIDLNLNNWIISGSQATAKQVEAYNAVRHKVYFNNHDHKEPPIKPFNDSLPADCCVAHDPIDGQPQNNLLYLNGNVYYCCNAFALTEHAGMNSEIVCDFNDDFMSKFRNKGYNQDICKYCICNHKIWNRL